VAGIALYETAIQPDWIDYNGHLRDAYYGLIVSLATDALMDRIGLDAAYRARTQCTLYTVELHLHYLQEIKRSDTAQVGLRILGADQKRIHAAFELRRAGSTPVLAATAEAMLVHVQQQQTVAKSAPFPQAVSALLADLVAASAALSVEGPASRRMELRSRGAAP
jgi:acyl-CoA thioester hydrolase